MEDGTMKLEKRGSEFKDVVLITALMFGMLFVVLASVYWPMVAVVALISVAFYRPIREFAEWVILKIRKWKNADNSEK